MPRPKKQNLIKDDTDTEEPFAYLNPFAEKWTVTFRPETLKDLLGDQVVTGKIKSIIESESPPRSILLSGPTGVGKTTVARIMAKRFCDPKGEHNYQNILSTNDVKEVNCGEDRSIETIRELVQASNMSPMRLAKRVFILDEVHQLTPQAASALLKPLEEPKPTSIWILCTNNPQKLKPEHLNRTTHIQIPMLDKKTALKLMIKVSQKAGAHKGFPNIKESPASVYSNLVREASLMIMESQTCFSGRDIIEKLQSTLRLAALSNPKTIDEALDRVEDSIKNSFELEEGGPAEFIETFYHNPKEAAKRLIEMAYTAGAFESLYQALRYKLLKSPTKEAAQLLTWCTDASAKTAYSGIPALDYVAAQIIIEHLKGR